MTAYRPGSLMMVFLSTLPVRGATYGAPQSWSGYNISIHAPREGSDETRKALGK